MLAPVSLRCHGGREKVWADTLYSCILHEVLPKGMRVTNWNNKNGKALFWIRLLSENSGYLLLYAVNIPEHALPLREGGIQFGVGGYIVESQFLISLISHKASILILLCLTPMITYPSLWKLA